MNKLPAILVPGNASLNSFSFFREATVSSGEVPEGEGRSPDESAGCPDRADRAKPFEGEGVALRRRRFKYSVLVGVRAL